MNSTAIADGEEPGQPQPVITIEPRRRLGILGAFVDHPAVDWVIAVVVFGPIAAYVVPLQPLDAVESGVRFSFYAGIAGAFLAFVTVAFTPLAILVALSDTPGVRRLRRHDDVIRGQFLRSTLLLMLIAVGLLVAGVIDAAGQSPEAVRFLATIAAGLGAVKVVRLTMLFWAVLAADTGGRRVGSKS